MRRLAAADAGRLQIAPCAGNLRGATEGFAESKKPSTDTEPAASTCSRNADQIFETAIIKTFTAMWKQGSIKQGTADAEMYIRGGSRDVLFGCLEKGERVQANYCEASNNVQVQTRFGSQCFRPSSSF